MEQNRRRPPNLRQATQDGANKSCSSCQHFKSDFCQLYSWPVRAFHVCDSWVERTPNRSDKERRLAEGGQVVEASQAKTVVIRVDPGGAGA